MPRTEKIISDGRLRHLYDAARVNDEFATTRFWEYVSHKLFFLGKDWAVSSQQPPTWNTEPLRRVDLVIEMISSRGISEPVLFMEAKRHGATEVDRREVET